MEFEFDLRALHMAMNAKLFQGERFAMGCERVSSGSECKSMIVFSTFSGAFNGFTSGYMLGTSALNSITSVFYPTRALFHRPRAFLPSPRPLPPAAI